MSTPAAYAYLDSVIDLDECILYFAAQAYYDNMDWPGTNIKYWRERVTAGKWRWILLDLDFGFGLYAHGPSEDHIAFMFATVATRYSNPPWSTLLQRKLVQNPVIRNRFINQVADLLNTNFKSGTGGCADQQHGKPYRRRACETPGTLVAHGRIHCETHHVRTGPAGLSPHPHAHVLQLRERWRR